MEIYPAIDLYQGKVVRLERGDYQKQKVYSEEPKTVAERWAQEGTQWLHVVDLEGARTGKIQEWKSLEKILLVPDLTVQFGGGIRQKEDLERVFRLGVRRVVLGTKALDPQFLSEVTANYSGRIALGLDIRGDEVQVEGWLKAAGKSIFHLFPEIQKYRVSCLIVTDIERDGTLQGLNLAKVKNLLQETPFPLILSGGIRSLEDLRALAALKAPKLEGVIIGKALYEERIDLKEALQIIRGGGKP